MTIQGLEHRPSSPGHLGRRGAVHLRQRPEGIRELGPSTFGVFNPAAAIDQVSEFWIKALEFERNAAKELVGAIVVIGQNVRTQTESVTAAIREQGGLAKEAVREQTDKRYEALTRAELQADLVTRNLPKAGNFEEPRERLIADDKK